MTGNFTSLFKAFTKFTAQDLPPQQTTAQEEFFEFLDAFDIRPFHMVEQSIIGDVKATYKKIKPFIKWMDVNIQYYQYYQNRTMDYQWSTYG